MTNEELYQAIQDFKKFIQDNFPFKQTTFSGTQDPSDAGLALPERTFFIQIDGSGSVTQIYYKRGPGAYDWDRFGDVLSGDLSSSTGAEMVGYGSETVSSKLLELANSVASGLTGGAPMWGSIGEGLDNTAVDQFFTVPGTGDDYSILYRHDPGGVAFEVSRSPSSSRVTQNAEDIAAVQVKTNAINIAETPPYEYSITDEDGRVAMGVRGDGRVDLIRGDEQTIRPDETATKDLVWGIGDEDGRIGLGLNRSGKAVMIRDNELDVDGEMSPDLAWGMIDEDGRVAFGVTRDGRFVAFGGGLGGELSVTSVDGRLAVVDASGNVLTDAGNAYSPHTLDDDHFRYLGDRFNSEVLTYTQRFDNATPVAASPGGDLTFIMSAGQSLSTGGSNDNTAVVLGDPIVAEFCFSFHMGPRGRQFGAQSTADIGSIVPLHESLEEYSTGLFRADTHCSGMGQMLFQNTPDRRSWLMNSHGAGGASYLEIKKDGVYDPGKPNAGEPTGIYQRGIDQVTAGAAIAAEYGKTLHVPYLTLTHGEDDSGTADGVYKGYLEELIPNYQADIKAASGQTADVLFLVDQVGSRFGSFVPYGQHDFCRERADSIMPMPKYMLNWLYSDGSLSHLSAVGYCIMGEYIAKAILAYEETGSWRPLEPDSAQRTGTQVDVVFHVPAGDLVIDTTAVPACTNFGFEYEDSNGDVPVTDAQLVGTDTIRLTLGATPSGTGERVKCGYAEGQVHPNGSTYPMTNLRDSETRRSLVDPNFTLHNWCVIFRHDVEVL